MQYLYKPAKLLRNVQCSQLAIYWVKWNWNKWSKNSDTRLHRNGQIFNGRENLMWHQPGGSLAADYHHPCCSYWFFLLPKMPKYWFLCFSMGRTTPQNCSFQLGNLDPYLTHGSLSPPKSTPKQHHMFLQGTQSEQQTHRHTDWPCYSVFSNRPLLLAIAAMQPKKSK